MPHNKRNSPVYVVTFPLVTEKWQEDRLNKFLYHCACLYNKAQGIIMSIYKELTETPEWQEMEAIKDKDKQYEERNKILKNYVKTVQIQDLKMGKAGEFSFTEYGVTGLCSKMSKMKIGNGCTYSDVGINSMISDCIGKRVWASWCSFFYGTGKSVHKSKIKDFNSFSNRFKKNGFYGMNVNVKDKTISFDVLEMVLKFIHNENHEYERIALESAKTSLRTVCIKREFIRGRYKFYVSLGVEGVPFDKGVKIGQGVVGIDPGVSTVTSYGQTVKQMPMVEIQRIEKEIAKVQRAMDRSRRATNPFNYYEDGRIKPKAERKPWIRSSHYNKLLYKLRELHRKLSVKRKLIQQEWANDLIREGDVFQIELTRISSMAKRSESREKDENGRFKNTHRFGRSIHNYAPSQGISILTNKVKARGGVVRQIEPHDMKATGTDHTSHFQYTKHNLGERRVRLSDGCVLHRDGHAALNVKHAIAEEVKVKVHGKIVTKYVFKCYDKEGIDGDYEQYKIREREAYKNGSLK